VSFVCPYGYPTAGRKIQYVQSGLTPATVLKGGSLAEGTWSKSLLRIIPPEGNTGEKQTPETNLNPETHPKPQTLNQSVARGWRAWGVALREAGVVDYATL
jgi:hypothetical protein